MRDSQRDPFPAERGPENLRLLVVSKRDYHNSCGFIPAPWWLTTWAVKMPMTLYYWVERITNQKSGFARPYTGSPLQPSCDQRSFSDEDLLWLKDHLIPHDEVRRPRQLVGKGIVRNHKIRLLHLAIVVRPGLRIAASGALGCLGLGPREIFIAAFLVAFSFHLVITKPLARYLAAIGHIVPNLGKARDRPGLQHDGQRQNLADTEDAL